MAPPDDTDLTFLLQFPTGFPRGDLLQLGQILADAAIFVPGFRIEDAAHYDPDFYLYQTLVARQEFIILPDRNLASRIAQVGAGEQIGAQRRMSAVLMAFAQGLNLNFEPSICFHELAHRLGNAAALAELRRFKAADEAAPAEWIDLALGRRDRMAPHALPAVSDHDLEKPLRRWNRNYIVALKIAELELSDGTSLEKLRGLVEWMFDDFILAGPSFMFASMYLSPTGRRRRMIKQLRSPDRESALAGVRNAAWDLTHLSDFSRLVQEAGDGPKRYLLATSDKALAALAFTLLLDDEHATLTDGAAETLAQWWPLKEARGIAQLYGECLRRCDDRSRRNNQNPGPGYLEQLRSDLERIVREWKG